MKQMLFGCLPEISSTGDFYCAKDVEVILQSIFVIFNTKLESRVWQPQFGCRLKEYIWDILDDTTLENIKNDLENSLTMWEPRIYVKDLSVTKKDTLDNTPTIDITISFTFDRRDYTHVFEMSAKKDIMDMSVYDLKINN